MSKLDDLINKFEKFPGIGARQARRFAFYILTLPETDTAELASLIKSLKETVTECVSCQRFFARNGGSTNLCSICDDPNREHTSLLIVERDSDVVAMERSRTYNGLYFVLGGTVPLLDGKGEQQLRSGALKAVVEQRTEAGELKELILAFSVNPDGENTGRYLESLLKDYIAEHNLKVTQLGRGLSTGSELEYADPETLKNALKNRQ